MILLSDPRVAAVPSADDGDPFVDLPTVPELRLDERARDPDGWYRHLRGQVVDRLLTAQHALPRGVRLLVVEGYRPYHGQLAIFTGYQKRLRRAHPGWSERRLHVETSKFVSPVEVAPHTTGGAVDLTLCSEDGVELDMGTAIDATPEDSANACFTAADTIGPQATANRRMLVRALTSVGLVNYPTEWWHWSYGDRYWALMTGAPATRYAAARIPAARVPVATPR